MNSYELLLKIAMNGTDPGILTILAVTGDWEMRYQIARNPAAPTNVLKFLTHDIEASVRYNAKFALKNRACSGGIS